MECPRASLHQRASQYLATWYARRAPALRRLEPQIQRYTFIVEQVREERDRIFAARLYGGEQMPTLDRPFVGRTFLADRGHARCCLPSSGATVAMRETTVRMIVLRIVLPQHVHAIVIAIRRAHHRVDVVAGGFIVVVDDARLVVELDEHHGIEDTIVKGASVIERADPSEMRFTQVALRLLVGDLAVAPT